MRSAISAAFLSATVAFTAQAGALVFTAAAADAAPAAAQSRRDVLRPAGGDRALQQIIRTIRADADALRNSLNSRVRQDRSRRSPEDDVQYAVDDVVTAADHLADHSSRGEINQLDIDDILRRGSALESALSSVSASPAVRSAWSALQRDLDRVASAFGQTWDWRNPSYANSSSSAASYNRLSGTYELDQARSGNPRRAVAPRGRGRAARDIDDRLTPPERIAIERTGSQVTLASSDAPRASFDANGQLISERRGSRMATTRASVYGDRVEVTTNGTGEDFTATFEPLDGGRSLRLTRQFFSEGSSQPIVVRSIYRRTSEQPDWSVFNGRYRDAGRARRTGNAGDGIDDGTIFTATLDAPLDLRSVRENDRVSLTVHHAPETRLENAVLDGYVSRVPTDADGRSDLAIVFNRIRMSNGRTADFTGTVETMRGPNGEPISFEGERVESDDQKDQAIKRGAIGAAIGAIVGAVAGGSKGAAIGAVLGGGGGAATVLIGGQRQNVLPRGTEFTVRTQGWSNWN